jgi:hypothetical protein
MGAGAVRRPRRDWFWPVWALALAVTLVGGAAVNWWYGALGVWWWPAPPTGVFLLCTAPLWWSRLWSRARRRARRD